MWSGNEENRNRSRDDRGRNSMRGDDRWASNERNERDRSGSYGRGSEDEGRGDGGFQGGYEDESPRSRQRDMGGSWQDSGDFRAQGSQGNRQSGRGQESWRRNDQYRDQNSSGNRGAYGQGGQQFGSQYEEDRGARFQGDYGPSARGGDYGSSYRGGDYGSGAGNENFGSRDYSRFQGGQSDDMGWNSRGGSDRGGMSGMESGQGRGMQGRRSQQDSMRGKGPKGWQRSDETIKNELCEVLARHHEIDPSEVDIQVQGGEITLTGSVSDREQKRMIEDAAERIFGASEVQNQLRVSNGGAGRQQGASETDGSDAKNKDRGNKATKNAITAS